MPPRLGARLAYKAKFGGFAAAPAHPTPRLLDIFVTQVGWLSCSVLRPIFLQSFVAGTCSCNGHANVHVVLRPSFLQSFVAGTCSCKGHANVHAVLRPSFLQSFVAGTCSCNGHANVHAVLRLSFLQWRWRKRQASPGSRPRRRRALLAATLAMENPNLCNNQYNNYSKKNKDIV